MCLCGNITITLNQVPADCNNCFQFLSWPLSSLQFKLSDANWERVDLDVIELINYLEYKKKVQEIPLENPGFTGPQLGTPSFPRAEHLASNPAFFSLPCSADDGLGGPEPGWDDPQTWVSFQGTPKQSGIRPGGWAGHQGVRASQSPTTILWLLKGYGLLHTSGQSGACASAQPGDSSA